MFPLAKFSLAKLGLPISVILVSAILACLAACELRAETSAPRPRAAKIANEQIERWVAQLDDNHFDRRQRAQQQLARAGKPALRAVATAAASGSLESSTRAINILLQWSEAKEQDLQLVALVQLAALTNRPRESAMAARLLADAREQAALKTITKLGGRVTNLDGYGNLQIEINKDWKGGNEGMQLLAEVRHAKRIRLRVAPITDPGLEPLAELAQVQILEIHGTKISKEALKKIKRQLPNTIIDFRNGAMLGIRGNPNDTVKGSVVVMDVVTQGAADKAGIVPGDRITKFNGETLEDFTALTDRIATYQAGDTVQLTLLRKNKMQTVQVTFGLWGSTDNNRLVGQKVRSVQQMPLQGLPIPAR